MRIKPADRTGLPEDLAAAMSRAEAMMGFTPNDGLLMARKPALMKAVAAMVDAIYGGALIEPGLARLIGYVASTAAGCRYCKGHTAFGALKYDVPTEKLAAAWSYETSGLFSDAERAALRLAHHASTAPHEVTDEVYDAARAHWSEDEVLEIVSIIALFGFLNRWNATFGTDLEDEVTEGLRKGMA